MASRLYRKYSSPRVEWRRAAPELDELLHEGAFELAASGASEEAERLLETRSAPDSVPEQIRLSYVSAGGSGTLTVSSGSTVVAQINMIGNYTSANFSAIADSNGKVEPGDAKHSAKHKTDCGNDFERIAHPKSPNRVIGHLLPLKSASLGPACFKPRWSSSMLNAQRCRFPCPSSLPPSAKRIKNGIDSIKLLERVSFIDVSHL
jgi:hypothetical protein